MLKTQWTINSIITHNCKKIQTKNILPRKFVLREDNKTKNCIIQTLLENQNNLLKYIKSIDGRQSKMFPRQHAQSNNFITPRHYVKKRDARKSFTIETRNQFQLLENVIEEQLNNNELNMVQETTNNHETTLLCQPKNLLKSYHQVQTLLPIILFHLMQTIASIILEDLKKIMQKNIATISTNTTDFCGFGHIYWRNP